MADDCREESTVEVEVEEDEFCCVGKIVSDSLDITPRKDEGCDCYEVRIELKEEEEEECTLVSTMMPNDIFTFKRNDIELCIKFSDLLIALGCKKEYLE